MSIKIISFIIVCGVAGLACAQTTVVGPSETLYVNPGESVSFTCRVTWATDAGVHSILWGIGRHKDDQLEWTQIAQCFELQNGYCEYREDYSSRYSIETNSPIHDRFTLTVISATLDQDGYYDCWPSNGGTPSSPHARLVVLNEVTNVFIKGFTNRRTVEAGDTVITECMATSGNPAAEISWTIDGRDVSSQSNSTVTETGEGTRLFDTTSILSYAFNSSDDQQNLRCESFQHDSLTNRSAQILMDVKHPPEIQAIVANSWEGNRVVVECLASANPGYIQYSWESDDGQFGGDSRTWELTDENGDQKVTVTCTVSNGEETDSLTEVVNKPAAVSLAVWLGPKSVLIFTMYTAVMLALFGY